jgi:predicted RNA-binding Zn ribbon-like protein
LVADALGLDFLNSVARPHDAVVDWIDSGEGLVDWLGQLKLVPSDTLRAFRRNASADELDRVAEEARELREWFREAVARNMGRSLGPDALQEFEPINRLLERDEAYMQIVPEEGDGATHFHLERRRRWRGPEALLLPIAEAMSRLICEENFAHVKHCEGPSCTLMFVDRTRRRSRRWCSMAACGNRAKQATHRRKSSAEIDD